MLTESWCEATDWICLNVDRIQVWSHWLNLFECWQNPGVKPLQVPSPYNGAALNGTLSPLSPHLIPSPAGSVSSVGSAVSCPLVTILLTQCSVGLLIVYYKIMFKWTQSLSNAICFKHVSNISASALSALILLGLKFVVGNGFSDIRFLYDATVLAIWCSFLPILAISHSACAVSTVFLLPIKNLTLSFR